MDPSAHLPGSRAAEPAADVAAAPDAPAVPTQKTDWRDALSVGVRDLAEIALSLALEAVVAAGSPMLPFVVLEDASGRRMTRFDGDPVAAIDHARAYAEGSGADRAAVCWDGWLTVGGVRQDAVVVQASDRRRSGVVVAHRYRETLEGVVVVGKPVLVGPGDPVVL
jgi:hypothetical protein